MWNEGKTRTGEHRLAVTSRRNEDGEVPQFDSFIPGDAPGTVTLQTVPRHEPKPVKRRVRRDRVHHDRLRIEPRELRDRRVVLCEDVRVDVLLGPVVRR